MRALIGFVNYLPIFLSQTHDGSADYRAGLRMRPSVL